jgi:hypothetical protein
VATEAPALAAVAASGAIHAAATTATATVGRAALPSTNPELNVRAAQLDQREQALKQRERELAEQRRILAEEYRLLRARTAPPATGDLRYRPASVDAPAFHAIRQESFWDRVKSIFGSTATAD